MRAGGGSLLASLGSWVILIAALIFGGADPSGGSVGALRVASMGAALVAVLALFLAVGALLRGSQRVAAAFGLALSCLFLLSFTGLGFSLLP